MMIFKTFIKSFLRIILFSSLVNSILTYEASALSVSVDKPRIEVKSLPGSTKSGSIQVKNKSTVPIAVKVSIEDWIYDENGKRQFKPAGSTPLSCADWLDLNPRRMIIEPNEANDVDYTIKVPEDATGGHYAVIFFEASGLEEEEAFKGMGVKLVGRIGTVVYHEIEDKVNKIGSIQYLEVDKPGTNKPLVLRYRFRNDGNAFIRFKGVLNIMDKEGNIYGNAESKEEQGTLPGNIREDVIKWFGSLPKGEYDLILTVDMGEDTAPLVREESFVLEEDI